MTEELKIKGSLAKEAAYKLAAISTEVKNNALLKIAEAIVENAEKIIAENKKDIEAARKKGTREAMIDRLTLTKERIEGIAEGVRKVIDIEDPMKNR